MTPLNSFTCRRLNHLPKLPHVWEGDRRQIMPPQVIALPGQPEAGGQGSDCILWVDGGEGTVRAVSMVPTETGHEAIVRALVQAMEHPQPPSEPGRPSKLLVCDREIQFFLRGALQGVDIEVEYVARLPLIDDLFEGLLFPGEPEAPSIPEAYEELLLEKADLIWQDSPWYYLNEQTVLAVEINRWDIGTLYVSVLGMAGVEHGLLMYRSLDSLRQFRQRVLGPDQSPKQLQQAFLEQDCLFLNYEPADDEEGMEEALLPAMSFSAEMLKLFSQEMEPEFGSLHPLEGLRTSLEDEEAAVMIVAMESLHRFLSRYSRQLDQDPVPTLEGRYRIPNPEPGAKPATVSIKVSTLPELTQELLEETEASLQQSGSPMGPFPILRDDYVPEGAMVLLTSVPVAWVKALEQGETSVTDTSTTPKSTKSAKAAKAAADQTLPVILIQTTRPKGEMLIQDLSSAGGVAAVCFNPGSDPISGEEFLLGLFATGNREFHLFMEYSQWEKKLMNVLQDWQAQCEENQGQCAIVVAGGLTGKARGKPQFKDLLGLFRTELKTPEDLGLVRLELRDLSEW